MTRDEVKKQALTRLKLSLRPDLMEKATVAADETLEPFKRRDETEVGGNKLAPYNFEYRTVLWLERKIREKLKL